MSNIIKTSQISGWDFSPARVLAPIECDELCQQPPAGLKVAGFSWKGTPSAGSEIGWDVDENLVDTIVFWSSISEAARSSDESLDCVLEVDYKDGIPAADLVHVANYGGFSLALVGLQPGASEAERQAYAAKLKELALSMLGSSSFSRSLYPFSCEFEAIFLEKLGKSGESEAMRQRWASGLVDALHPSGARVEYALKRTGLGLPAVKAACREALLEHFGSEEAISDAAWALARPIANRIAKFADEIKAQPKAKQDRFGLADAMDSADRG